MTNAPITAALNDPTVKPGTIRVTAQKNAPLISIENNPSVRMLSGNVRRFTIGLTIMLRNTSIAATMTAVRIVLTVMPPTKNGRANTASVVINQRRIIILVKK